MSVFSTPCRPLVLAATMFLLGCGGAAERGGAGGVARTDGTEAADMHTAADHSRMKGDTTATVWLIVASDFQCPYCRLWHEETERQIVRDYVQPGRVRMAFLNFPISSHGNAMPAAEAAMCAGVQGRFWEVHDAIFATQQRWSSDPAARRHFSAIAGEHVADVEAWRNCVETGAMRPLIEADRDRAEQVGVRSTPSFFINGRPIVGAQPYEAFRRELDAALEAARSAPARPGG